MRSIQDKNELIMLRSTSRQRYSLQREEILQKWNVIPHFYLQTRAVFSLVDDEMIYCDGGGGDPGICYEDMSEECELGGVS